MPHKWNTYKKMNKLTTVHTKIWILLHIIWPAYVNKDDSVFMEVLDLDDSCRLDFIAA